MSCQNESYTESFGSPDIFMEVDLGCATRVAEGDLRRIEFT
jgi:hypothetical protein